MRICRQERGGLPGPCLLLVSLISVTIICSAASNISVGRRLLARGEINPVSPKFETVPDKDMPGLPDWSILAKDNLSYWDDDTMSITSTRYFPGAGLAGLHLANGYTGLSTYQPGPFPGVEVNQTNHPDTFSQPHQGWPLFNDRISFATVEGFYDCQPTTPGVNYEELQQYGCESVIAGIPHSLAFYLVVGDQILNSTVANSTIGASVNRIRLQDGLPSWSYTWSPSGTNISFDIEFIALVSRDRPNVAATQLRVTPRGGDYIAGLVDYIDGTTAIRSFLAERGSNSSTSMHVSVHPDGQPNATAWVVSNANVSNGYTNELSRVVVYPEDGTDMSMAQQWDVHLVDGETATFHKFVGVASTDQFDEAKLQAIMESERAARDGFDLVAQEHVKAWNTIMDRNRITNYRDPVTCKLPNDTIITMLQAAAAVHTFNILSNLNKAGSGLDKEGVAVAGLTSDAYGGLRFWDQDLWMFPAVALTQPHLARQFLEFRVEQFQQALQNSQAPYVQVKHKFDKDSPLFPWTSGRWGNATGTGPALDYEYHINSDIVLMFFQYLAITGDDQYFDDKLWPIAKGVAHTIGTLLVRDGTGWSLQNMTDPDEFANNVDDGAFTLASFASVLAHVNEHQKAHDLPVNKTWVHMAASVNIPKAKSGIIKEYFGMPNNVTVKQADVWLLSHPLDNPEYHLKDQRINFAYYLGKQTPDGPAMTYAIAAIIENQIAASGVAAFMLELAAVEPYLRAPFYQMSEQANDDANANGGTSPAVPFLTGHGGALQIPIFGYLGLKLLRKNPTFRPSLPHPYKNLGIADIHIRGNRLRAAMNSTHTNITRLPLANDVTGVFDVYPNRLMPITIERRSSVGDNIEEKYYNITMHETITVENDMYWQRLTTPNNILQGQPTSSKTEHHTAQYPGSATDGNTGTRWQPLSIAPAELIINTSMVPYQRVTEMNFDWGPRVPAEGRVGFTNRTDLTSLDDAERVIPLPVVPNKIYGADAGTPEIEVVPYEGNRTMLTTKHFGKSLWTGQFVILEIEGCQGCGLKGRVLENGRTIWQDDGRGATVGEFEIIGEKGTNTVESLAKETADERQGTNEDLLDGDILTPKPKDNGR